MRRLLLTGTSMGRWLQDRVVEVEETPASALRAGDLVAYRKGGKLLLHRVRSNGPGGLWVQDDVAALDRHRVEASEVLGRPRGLGWKSHGNPGLFYAYLSTAWHRLKALSKAL